MVSQYGADGSGRAQSLAKQLRQCRKSLKATSHVMCRLPDVFNLVNLRKTALAETPKDFPAASDQAVTHAAPTELFSFTDLLVCQNKDKLFTAKTRWRSCAGFWRPCIAPHVWSLLSCSLTETSFANLVKFQWASRNAIQLWRLLITRKGDNLYSSVCTWPAPQTWTV